MTTYNYSIEAMSVQMKNNNCPYPVVCNTQNIYCRGLKGLVNYLKYLYFPYKIKVSKYLE